MIKITPKAKHVPTMFCQVYQINGILFLGSALLAMLQVRSQIGLDDHLRITTLHSRHSPRLWGLNGRSRP